MSDLFKKKKEADKRTVRWPVRFTVTEAEQVKYAAQIRNLDIAEFMHRAALGRKADVRFDQQIVFTLSQLVNEIRSFYKICEENKTPLPSDVVEALRKLIIDSGDAIQRISK